jgi:hypothetical protein
VGLANFTATAMRQPSHIAMTRTQAIMGRSERRWWR